MILSHKQPGIYACWVTPQSRGYFINRVTSDNIYCIYDSYADKAMNYKFTDNDFRNSDFAIIFPADEFSSYPDLKLKYPEIFI